MHSAPPVLVPVGRFVWGRRLALLAALLVSTVSGLLAWWSGLGASGLLTLLGACLLVLVLAGQLAPLEVLPAGELSWDGEAWWFCGSGAEPERVQLQVAWDAGRAMLLRLSAQHDRWRFDRYAWLEASRMPLQWHGLRCAVHAGDTS